MDSQGITRIAYPIDDGLKLIGISRTRGYRAVQAGELRTYRDGKRRMVSHEALLDYVALREQQYREAIESGETFDCAANKAAA